jgi:hypothetical protein
MKTACAQYAAIAAMVALCAAGCQRTQAVAPPPLSVEQMPPLLQQSLADANQEAKTEAAQYVAAMQKHDWAEAFAELKQLRSEPSLTQEQRAILARVHLTTIHELNDAAGKGDESAAAVFNSFKANK